MFTKSLQRILNEIIGKTFNSLRFNLLGPDRVSKAFVFSMRGSHYNPNTTIASAYINANALNTNDPSSIDKKTIERLTDVAEEYIDNLEQKSNADISRIVSQFSSEISTQAKILGQTEREILLSSFGEEIIKKLKAELKDQKKRIDKAAEVIAEYERHNAYNFGATDGIITAARAIGIQDPTVFKVLVDDERLCKYCRKLWLMPDGATPRVYKLSELAAAPGKDYKNPLPSIAPSHLNCRCVLVTLMPGFGFKDGKIAHKGLDPDTKQQWDEYLKQR